MPQRETSGRGGACSFTCTVSRWGIVSNLKQQRALVLPKIDHKLLILRVFGGWEDRLPHFVPLVVMVFTKFYRRADDLLFARETSLGSFSHGLRIGRRVVKQSHYQKVDEGGYQKNKKNDLYYKDSFCHDKFIVWLNKSILLQ